MNVGEKIRALRVAKLMTQSELAGGKITRNMISCIENGAAQPSLPTVVYLAERLGVPVGFLLADEGEEPVYRKMNSIANMKRAFREGDWMGCRSLCLSVTGEPDDELCLLLAQSCLGIAEDAFWSGRLHSACRSFDEAMEYAAKTIYPQPQLMATAEVYFRFMQRISPTLYSEILDDGRKPEIVLKTPFAAYVDALDALDADNPEPAQTYFREFSETSFFAKHLQAKYHLKRGEFTESKTILTAILVAPAPILNEVELYVVLSDLEIACRETDDYKGAYRYANERVQLHEQLLKK